MSSIFSTLKTQWIGIINMVPVFKTSQMQEKIDLINIALIIRNALIFSWMSSSYD